MSTSFGPKEHQVMVDRSNVPTVTVAEPQQQARKAWTDAFENIPGIYIVGTDLTEVLKRELIDCMVVMNIAAGEVYCGGPPVIGGVQFCSTNRYKSTHPEANIPAWVVSVVAFPINWVEQHGVVAAAAYNFRQILERIREHNVASPNDTISSLGTSGELLVLGDTNDSTYRSRIDAIKQTYLDLQANRS